MSESVLRTEGLTMRFGGLTAVDNLSFTLGRSRLHAIIGPNGAGKTTLFNLVCGLIRPHSGRVFFQGRDITGLKPHQISRLGIKRTMQIKSVFPTLSVVDNLWITAHGGRGLLNPFRSTPFERAMREKIDQTISEIGLSALADRSAGTLSYGDVALLEIGMALISEPRLLLLDEPTCGMSPAETVRVARKIRELTHAIDVIIIEHDMEVVFGIADEIIVMAQGAILASGSASAIAADERVREAYLGRDDDEDYVEEAAHA